MGKYFLCALLFLCCCQNIFCQNIPGTQTSCTAASQGTAGKITISYTIGEMPLVQSWLNNGLLITQGINQPLTFIADTAHDCFTQTEVKIYPNPIQGIFSLQLNILKTGNAKVILFDAAGRQLQQEEFIYNSFTTRKYDINKLPGGQYFLQLLFTATGSSKSSKCFYSIQKLN
jgi:hypothetical protein